MAAAVILPRNGGARCIDDSTKLSALARERLCGRLKGYAMVGIGIVQPDEIDTINIHWATMKR